jgi:hypothetical protein
MRFRRTENGSSDSRTRGRLTYLLAIIVMAAVMVGNSAGTSAQSQQQGVSKPTCRADNVYIYKYATTQSERRGRMGRGWVFRVYHYVNGTWAFGVHNGSGVSGYVLREKLCD